MENAKMLERLWDLSNYVTGFAVAQSLATTFSVASGQLKALSGTMAHVIALIAVVMWSGLYCYVVDWLQKRGTKLDSANAELWTLVDCGRYTAIVLFGFVVFITVAGDWWHETVRAFCEILP